MAFRMEGTENPYIEDVLESYSSLPNLTMMALGSSYWGPPAEALQRVGEDLCTTLLTSTDPNKWPDFNEVPTPNHCYM